MPKLHPQYDYPTALGPVSPGIDKGIPTGSRSSRVVGCFRGAQGPVGKVAKYLSDYIALPPRRIIVAAAWIVAARLVDRFDRFPHLAITSPEKRCGKTRFLQLVERVVPEPYNTTNISPAALYRLIEQKKPTLLLDEAQSIARRGSEASEVLREIFNSGIDRNAKVIRCGGKNMNELHEFRVYSPKVIALIGELDSVLADRCLAIELKRKSDADKVLPYRSRIVEPRGDQLSSELASWAEANADHVAQVYDSLEPFPIDNDRMAELLLPLQAVLTVGDESYLPELEAYAFDLERAEAESENKSPGVLLLNACREIFDGKNQFMGTANLVAALHSRTHEPWATWNRSNPITETAVAKLLRPYGIRPDKRQQKVSGFNRTVRGYWAKDFTESWGRYLPACTSK